MNLKEWNSYKFNCKKNNTKPKSNVRQLIYFRLITKHGFDLVFSHVNLIKKILDK